MSSTTFNLPYKRFVAQVSTDVARSKSSWLAMMTENLEALKACPWRDAADVEVSLTPHDFKLSYFGDSYDAYKMTGNYDSKAMTEIGYAGMAAYRFTIPDDATTRNVALASVALPVSRDRFLKGGLRIVPVLSDAEVPSDDWSVVRGDGEGASVEKEILKQTVSNLVSGTPGAETVEIDLSGISSGNPSAYLWLYVTLEDYTDYWEMYDAKEKRLYAIEGSAMLVGGSVTAMFAADVSPDEGSAVLLAGGSSPTWLQPLPTVNVGNQAPTVSAGAEQIDTFFTSAVRVAAPKAATWQISGVSNVFSFTATLSLYGTDPNSVSGSISVTGPDFSQAQQDGQIPTAQVTEQGTMTVVTSENKKYLHYISSAAGYYATYGGSSFYYPAKLHVYIQLPTFVVASESQGTYTVTSADAKWFTRINLAQAPDASVTQNAPSSGVLYGTFGLGPTVAQVCDVTSVYWMLKMTGGAPTEMDMCASLNEASRQGLASVVTGSASPWLVSVGGYAFAVAVAGRAVTLSESPSGQSWNFTLSEELAGEYYFDPAVRLYLPGEDANDAVTDYGMASVVGDFSHAVATFEAGDQPSDAELLERLARMSRGDVGRMLYLHPMSAALANELDMIRPVPRFFRASTAPTDQTTCQPGLSGWYCRAAASTVALGIVQEDNPEQEGVVANPAFLQLALLALRAPAAFATRIVLGSGESSVGNGFKLRFVAWRCAAELWDPSNAFAMAAMASMPSVYRADGPARVAWGVDCTGTLLRFGRREMSAERLGVSQTIVGDIAAGTSIEIPIVAPVGEGDVVIIAPEVLGFSDGIGDDSVTFGRQADPAGTAAAEHNYGWARYPENLGWFPRVTGE